MKIGIAGLGTVGVGVFNILADKKDLLAKRCGKELEVVAVSSRDQTKDRGVDTSGVKWYENAADIAADDNVDIVIELIGGSEGIAYELCTSALKNSKHVVTANKALIALHGTELAKLAEENSVSLMFEAAVAGGIPILKSLREGLSANNFSKISGIMNGTCNYILSAMAADKRAFDDVLQEAQDLGYAETPPDLDVDGIDTAHKLAIITALAYGCPVNFDAIYIEGIRNISPADIAYAKEMGYAIRLLGITDKTADGIEQRVHSCLVPLDSPLADINGALNAVLAECDSLGPAFFTGAGAGAGPTASSVVADIMDIASGRTSHPFGVPVAKLEQQKFVSIENHVGEYYVRIRVKDHSGVLASITSLFSEENIGVETVIQKARDKDKTAQIALITHAIKESSIKKALDNIGKKEYVCETPHMIRVENF